MDLDIKGEIGHMGYVIKLTFAKITLCITIITLWITFCRIFFCGVNHTRHAVFGLDFLTFLCYTSRYRKLNKVKKVNEPTK
jgi:hypothetical protein